MNVTTTFTIEGLRIVEYKGVVRGLVVRSPTISQGFRAGLKQFFGGTIQAYIEVCEQARQQAYDEMIRHARDLGADAIVGVRYDSSPVSDGTEVLCYGTAVVTMPESKKPERYGQPSSWGAQQAGR